jgi:hypothetical protein
VRRRKISSGVAGDLPNGPSAPHRRARGGLDDMTTAETLAGKPEASPFVSAYLQLDPRAHQVIPKLVHVHRDPDGFAHARINIQIGNTPDGNIESLAEDFDPFHTDLDGLEKELWGNLYDVVGATDGYLIGLVAEMLRAQPDEQIGAFLVELWHVAEEEFDPSNPANTDDYNMDDLLPTSPRETPHLYLIDLMMDTVILRLMKRHGPELLLAWSDAVRNLRPA